MGDLSIQNLTVEYSSGGDVVRPIDGFNLDVAAGSLVILLGPSGCGKTTLLSCLGAILRPSGGAIKFGDVDVTSLDARGISTYRRQTVGIVFQAFNLVPSLTAAENVMVPMLAAGMSRRAAFKKAEQLLSRVGLQDRVSHRPGDLSGGQQQRVAVARAIALDPPLVLADEPTAHLDFIQVEEVLRLIRELASGDRMVVVATHDNRILPLADRVVDLVPDFTSTDRPPDTVQVSAGEVLFEQGTMGDLIYVVSEGELEIVRELAGGGEELLTVAARGRTRAEDRELACELLASAKDRAENVMIVDVLRNDLGRVCRPGSVRVPRLCRLERTAAVQHLVSTVTGVLNEGSDAFDLLAASFPGGSITGAPKIRAMEILESLEPVRRGPYTGSLGWIGPDGGMQTSILIRTFVADGRRLTLHVGGGITWKSDPAAEWVETEVKARGPLQAIGGAEIA